VLGKRREKRMVYDYIDDMIVRLYKHSESEYKSGRFRREWEGYFERGGWDVEAARCDGECLYRRK